MDWLQRIRDRRNKTTPKGLRAIKGILHEQITKLDETQVANAHEAVGCGASGRVLADEAYDLAESARCGPPSAKRLRDIAKRALVAAYLLDREAKH